LNLDSTAKVVIFFGINNSQIICWLLLKKHKIAILAVKSISLSVLACFLGEQRFFWSYLVSSAIYELF
jgi:hypothetical protein